MNIQKLMKQMQQAQAGVQKIQEEMAAKIVEGTAGGGSIMIEISGGYEVQKVKISPEALADMDAEMLEDMVKAALEDALGKVAEMSREAMAKAMGGMAIPGMPGMTGPIN